MTSWLKGIEVKNNWRQLCGGRKWNEVETLEIAEYVFWCFICKTMSLKVYIQEYAIACVESN